MTVICFESLGTGAEREAVSAMLHEAALLPMVAGAWIGDPAAGSVNAGDLLCRIMFDSLEDWHAWRDDPFWDRPAVLAALAKVTGRDRIVYAPGAGASRQEGAGAVWRGLVFALNPGAPVAEAGRLAAGLLAMPGHIPEIRGWRLSTAIEASGARCWTHIWEQEFDHAGDLRGPYLMHPVHWGHVDGWFDVECPQWIVDPHLIHCFADVGGAISL